MSKLFGTLTPVSTLKTIVDAGDILSFLKAHVDENIQKIQFIKGGEISQAFSYTSKGDKFVIRVNNDEKSYEKDKFAYTHFQTKTIPIPEILDIGKFSHNLFYVISKQAIGKNLDEWDDATQERLLPQLISILEDIHKSKPTGEGYGNWDITGNAKHNSWKDVILPKKDDSKYSAPFYEDAVIERLEDAVKGFIKYLPEERYLVHGDYGFNNVVSDGTSITGILDWGESMYGDFMYDIAWLEFWPSNIDYDQVFKEHYLSNGTKVPNYEERLKCYQLVLGTGGLKFFAQSEQEGSYIWTRDRLLSLVK